MNTDNNKKVVLRFNKELLEKGNTEVLKEIISYDFINHTAPANMPHDINGMIQLVKVLHQGEIMGHPATGKKVTMSVMDIVRVKNGKYTDHWGLNDIMQVIAEL
jgi:predicted SnoaL-like aldol condensation-catalyzing enzyme